MKNVKIMILSDFLMVLVNGTWTFNFFYLKHFRLWNILETSNILKGEY